MTGARGIAALGRLVAGGAAEPDGDAALLARYAATADEAAFTALVRRHGPMVAAVCRRHLRQPADVDDAVQATFLVLTRKAGAVHTAVGPFLYRVAERTARRLCRSTRRTEPLPDLPARGGLPADVRAVVADELGRLPEPYRMAVELCYVAGFTTAEAAARLGWPRGTVLTRLAWARTRLRANLTRRGVTLGGSLAAVLADRATADVGPVLAGGSERVLPLCEGVIRAMTLTKLGWAAGLTAVAAVGIGFGSLAVGQVPVKPPASTQKSDAPRPVLPAPTPPAPELPSSPPTLPLPPPALEPTLTPPPPVSSLPAPFVPPIQPTTVPDNPVVTGGKTYTVPHPAGFFVREFADGERFLVRFADDRLFVEASYGSKDHPVSVSLEADYAMNKEGVVFGVITGLEAETLGDVTGLIGAPFAVRVRLDGTTLTVLEVRHGLNVGDLSRALRGRYTGLGKDSVPPAAKRTPGKPKFPGADGGEFIDRLPSPVRAPEPIRPSLPPPRTTPPIAPNEVPDSRSS